MDLNMMMREQALNGLNAQLDAAVTNGDTAAAREITKKISELTAATAPKAPRFTSNDVWAQAETLAPWLGVDPEKSAMANDFAKTMNPARFDSAKAMAEAVIKAVDAKFPDPNAGKKDGEGDGDGGGEGDGDGDGDGGGEGEGKTAAKPAARRKTDGPGEGDTLNASGRRRSSGPWTKLSDAPADVQSQINRQADKFAPKTKEGREKFISRALESSYQMHKGKK